VATEKELVFLEDTGADILIDKENSGDLKLLFLIPNQTRKNAIVEYLDYQLPVT